jgi:hypothetical protein
VARDAALVSVGVAVRDRRAGGHVVLVANGQDGFLQRDPDGAWRRIGFPQMVGPDAGDLPAVGAADPSDRTLTIAVIVAAVLLMTGLVVTVGGAWAASRITGRISAWWVAPVTLVTVVPCMLAIGTANSDELIVYPFTIGGPLVGVVAPLLLGALVTAWVAQRGPGRGWWALTVWGGGALTAVIGTMVWLTWPGPAGSGSGWTVLWAALGCVPGVVVAGVAARRFRPVPPPPYGSGTSSPGWAGTVGR